MDLRGHGDTVGRPGDKYTPTRTADDVHRLMVINTLSLLVSLPANNLYVFKEASTPPAIPYTGPVYWIVSSVRASHRTSRQCTFSHTMFASSSSRTTYGTLRPRRNLGMLLRGYRKRSISCGQRCDERLCIWHSPNDSQQYQQQEARSVRRSMKSKVYQRYSMHLCSQCLYVIPSQACPKVGIHSRQF